MRVLSCHSRAGRFGAAVVAAVLLTGTAERSPAQQVGVAADERMARRAIASEHAAGFLWTADLFERLARYEAQRDRYPTFAAFVPEIADYFHWLSPRIDSVVASWEARRPRLVATIPADGDTIVSAALDSIVLPFDRPMSGAYSIDYGPGGRAAFPDVVSASFDAARMVYTMRVRLRPRHSYHMIVVGRGFYSADGVPVARSELSFRTAGVP